MLISKQIADYIVFDTESIGRALEKISKNQRRIVFVVGEGGGLVGSISDGDVRRWIINASTINLGVAVFDVMNKEVTSKSIDANRQDIESGFSSAIELIPLVDSSKRLVAIAIKKEKGFLIGGFQVSETSSAYVIAEIGNNHNGSFSLAVEMVDKALAAGANCVKFQMRDLADLYKGGVGVDKSADLGAQYTMDLLSKFQLGDSELFRVFDYCREKGLTPLCTPWDLSSLRKLETYGMEVYKVASADFTNHELLEALAATGKPLICSTGMSTESEIKRSVDLLKKRGVEHVLLHCNSTYPTPFKDVNLAYMRRLGKIADSLVGYSGHERGISIPVAAVALGARVIEKHFTVDRSMEGNDHKVSLLPQEFAEMVKQIREVEEAMGAGGERVLTQGEMINRETLAKSLVSVASIKKGDIISRDMVEVKSPGQGLQPLYLEELIGRIAKRDMTKGDYFFASDLGDRDVKARSYRFSRPFGIPARYHDYRKLVSKSNFDFVEFHLSYQDLDLNLGDFFYSAEKIGFAVHCPELFSGDHIIDLCAADDSYLEHSIRELRRVCDITRELKNYFPKTDRPVIVLNAGGFNSTGFLPKSERSGMYKKIADSLACIDQEGVEVIIQTMPPFPWHFGGQSYHNLFIDPDEIAQFCSQYGYRICFDLSHSMMSCSYFKWDIVEFIKKVGPYIAHMHIVDALGVDGEGVQIGTGDVDFSAVSDVLNSVSRNVQFIPEIWQGHKNEGEGFWYALDFLERYFGGE